MDCLAVPAQAASGHGTLSKFPSTSGQDETSIGKVLSDTLLLCFEHDLSDIFF